jgi:hypothetical protein
VDHQLPVALARFIASQDHQAEKEVYAIQAL